jgi:hypothetical protein
METQFVEFSLVALASEHNPTILNPDFLQRNQIIRDEEWGWLVIGEPLTTPAVSTVQYDSQVSFTVEPLKAQVTDKSGGDIETNHACEIMSKYVQVVPHVPYSALGVNFTSITFVDDIDAFLFDRFLKEGAWNNDENRLLEAGFRFVYELDGGRIVYSVDKGKKPDVERPFILSRANFHRDLDLSVMPTFEQVHRILGNVQNDIERFNELQTAILQG